MVLSSGVNVLLSTRVGLLGICYKMLCGGHVCPSETLTKYYWAVPVWVKNRVNVMETLHEDLLVFAHFQRYCNNLSQRCSNKSRKAK
jgi:hypothetical protein